MNRKTFIKQCGFACIGISMFGVAMSGCTSSKSITAAIDKDEMSIPLDAFLKGQDGEKGFHDYLLVQNDALAFPVYVFRFDTERFSAIYLRCSHQGNSLDAYGDKLVCSAHGSEFTNTGTVINGPAKEPLTTFKTRLVKDNLLISLKAI